MKKIVSIILGIIVFAIPVFAFAVTDVSPVLLTVTSPVYEQVNNSPYYIERADLSMHHYSASSSDVYFVILHRDGSGYKWLAMSPNPGRFVYDANNDVVSSVGLTSESNGYYYYAGNFGISNTNIPISDSSDVTVFVNEFFSSNSVVFNLSDIVNGSVSWLSSMAQAVKSSGLLLFIVLFGFVGIGIGLLRRFTNG